MKKRTHLRPKLRNVTRWSSTYEMVARYCKISDILKRNDFPDEFRSLKLSLSEEANLRELFDDIMKDLESVTVMLQKGNMTPLVSLLIRRMSRPRWIEPCSRIASRVRVELR